MAIAEGGGGAADTAALIHGGCGRGMTLPGGGGTNGADCGGGTPPDEVGGVVSAGGGGTATAGGSGTAVADEGSGIAAEGGGGTDMDEVIMQRIQRGRARGEAVVKCTIALGCVHA